MTSTPPTARGPVLRSIIANLIIDGLCPFLTYALLTAAFPGIAQVAALGIGAIFPAANGIVGIVRRRHLDIIGIVVLMGIGASIVATLISGDPKLLLFRESFVTGALGLGCLLSLLGPRPLMFYIGRQFNAGHDPARIAAFNARWQIPAARRAFRVLTVAWGLGWVGEFALRVVLVETLSIPQVLAIAPFVFTGITFGLIAGTFAYVRRAQQQEHQQQSAPALSAGLPTER